VKKSDIENCIRIIGENRKFIIASHMNPEGDAVASSLAMAYILKKEKKKVWLYNRDKIPEQFSFLPNYSHIKNYLPKGKMDVAIIVDTATTELLGKEFQEFLKRQVDHIVKIDHHRTSEKFGDIKIIMPGACSTGEIIYYLLKHMRYRIDRPLADCIYTSIFTDTGGFHFPNSKINAFKIATEMVEAGVKPWMIYDYLFDHQTPNAIDLLSRALATLKLSAGGRIASIYVSENMLKSTKTTRKDTEGLINYPRSISSVKIAVMFREEDGKTKVSLRSKGDIDVSRIAQKYGGGGHKGASAFIFPDNLKSTMRKVLKDLEVYVT